MKYSIRTNEIKGNERQQGENASHLRGFATLTFGNDFKITNIAILESNEGKLFVSMPRYKSSDKDEKGANVYKDVCNPITKEFCEELYDNILEAFEKAKCADKIEEVKSQEGTEMPSFSVSVTPFEREGSNIGGLALLRIALL
ncbi:SpoVG family protein [Lachnoclostridium phytofermentans]|uniref:SpoVG family protein n=1 Tax=Lachnoclostridium phytofermentans TaxID=66219 RepID=UPI000A9FA826|nr:SpoVG family protein [Lachnoclostridium phytofermentans]